MSKNEMGAQNGEVPLKSPSRWKEEPELEPWPPDSSQRLSGKTFPVVTSQNRTLLSTQSSLSLRATEMELNL